VFEKAGFFPEKSFFYQEEMGWSPGRIENRINKLFSA